MRQNDALTPAERRRALQLLRAYLPSMQRHLGHVTPFLDAFLLDCERKQREIVVFELLEGGRFTVNGALLSPLGKGLLLAWIVLLAEERRFGERVRSEWYFATTRRPDACALQALQRVAAAVEHQSLTLASAIRSIRTERGELVVRRPVPEIQCASAWLAGVVRANAPERDQQLLGAECST